LIHIGLGASKILRCPQNCNGIGGKPVLEEKDKVGLIKKMDHSSYVGRDPKD
jgi:hypothetical protein